VQPWRSETFKFFTDAELVAKVTDVTALYLAPPENAVVLCGRREIPHPGVEPYSADAVGAAGSARAAHL
jgi:hypothetical protein